VTGVPSPDAFKPIALSWLTDGKLSAYPKTAGAQSIGTEAMKRLSG
jgi:hypothetical protein